LFLGGNLLKNLGLKIHPKMFRQKWSFVESVPGGAGAEAGAVPEDVAVHAALRGRARLDLLANLGPMLWFSKYFREKNLTKNCIFYSNLKNLSITLVLRQTSRKLAKIAENCDNSKDPRGQC
jgi:hypothetical protein